VPVGHDGYPDVPVLEEDETVPPRPEEEVADVARAVPDPAGHGAPDPADEAGASPTP
jgi:hypothetical protein